MGAGRGWACRLAGLAALLAAGAALASPTPIGPPMPPAPIPGAPALAQPQPGATQPLTAEQFKKLTPNQQAAARELVAISGELQTSKFNDELTRVTALTQNPDFLALPPVFTHTGFFMLFALDMRAGRFDDADAAIRV